MKLFAIKTPTAIFCPVTDKVIGADNTTFEIFYLMHPKVFGKEDLLPNKLTIGGKPIEQYAYVVRSDDVRGGYFAVRKDAIEVIE